MTKRQLQKKYREDEQKAVAMYMRGRKLSEIKKKTGVPGWMVRGLVVAHVVGNKM